MNQLQQAIERLKSSSHYQALATFKPPKPPFNPFEVMGATYREQSHSKVLGWLLRDLTNKEFRHEFVKWIDSKLGDNNPLAETIEQAEIRSEYGDDKAGRLDVFAYFPALELIIAIEVKVWAGEQDSQIQRYQDFLKRKYPDHKKVVIFLTPLGEASKTEDKGTGVPVLNMSWDEVAQIIDNMQPEDSDENRFRVQFSRHLSRRIVMKETEEQRIVKDLLREGDNAKTIQRIIDNMPPLNDFSRQWEKIVADVCGVEADGLEIETYSYRGLVKQLQTTVTDWCEAGLPFTLMLYKWEEDDAAGVRILLRDTAFEECREKLKEFASSSNGIVNAEFPSVDDWRGWRAVLAADGSNPYPDGTFVEAKVFYHDKKWKKKVEEKLQRQMSQLLDLIQNWLNKMA